MSDMNNLNLSPDKMDALLKLAGQKLGKSPENLKSQLEQGNLNQIIGGLDPKIQKQIGDLANNPTALNMLMQNNNVKNMLSGLMGGKK